MITTSPDGQWAAIRRGREVSLIAGSGGTALAQIELPTDDADLIIVGPPSVLAVVTRGRDDDGEPLDRMVLYQPPYLDAVARLDLDASMRIAAVTGPRVALLSRDGKAVQIVRIAGRGLSAQPLEPGGPVEFAVGLERNQVLFGMPRKLEAWDATSCRPLLRMQLPLPPPPRIIGPAHGHLWATQPGSDDILVCRLSDGRPFRHQVGAPISEVIYHPASPLLVLATPRGLVRLHCFAHAMTAIDAPWRPGTSLAQLVVGDDIALLGLADDDDEPWRVPIGGAGAPPLIAEVAPTPGPASEPGPALASEPAPGGEPAIAHANEPATAHDGVPATGHAGEHVTAPASEPARARAGEPAPAHAGEPAIAHADEPAIAHARDPATAHPGRSATAHADEPTTAHAGVLATGHPGEPAPGHAGEAAIAYARNPALPPPRRSAPQGSATDLPARTGAPHVVPLVTGAPLPAVTARTDDPGIGDVSASGPAAVMRSADLTGPASAGHAVPVLRLAAAPERITLPARPDEEPGQPSEGVTLSVLRPVEGVRSRVWRESLAAFAYDLARDVDGELPVVAADTELGQLAQRLGLSPAARSALIALYGRYLVGEPQLPIARLAYHADWTEALGQGELAAHGFLRRRGGRVALRGAVTDILDGALPRAIRIAGGTAAVTVEPPGERRIPRDARSDAAIEAELAAQLGRFAVIEGSPGRAVLEAYLAGLPAVALVPPAARPTPWPRDASLIVVAGAETPAWVAALPER